MRRACTLLLLLFCVPSLAWGKELRPGDQGVISDYITIKIWFAGDPINRKSCELQPGGVVVVSDYQPDRGDYRVVYKLPEKPRDSLSLSRSVPACPEKPFLMQMRYLEKWPITWAD